MQKRNNLQAAMLKRTSCIPVAANNSVEIVCSL